jgi:hypothetical protein
MLYCRRYLDPSWFLKKWFLKKIRMVDQLGDWFLETGI